PDAANEPPGAAYTVDLPEPVAGCITVVLEATYGPPQGTTAIAELEMFAEGERSGGGDALLAHIVAEGATGATTAAATLARRGAAIARLPVTAPGLTLLIDLAGAGGRELRRAVIDRLSSAPAAALLAAVATQTRAETAGDLWRALTRRAHQTAADRAPVL